MLNLSLLYSVNVAQDFTHPNISYEQNAISISPLHHPFPIRVPWTSYHLLNIGSLYKYKSIQWWFLEIFWDWFFDII